MRGRHEIAGSREGHGLSSILARPLPWVTTSEAALRIAGCACTARPLLSLSHCDAPSRCSRENWSPRCNCRIPAACPVRVVPTDVRPRRLPRRFGNGALPSKRNGHPRNDRVAGCGIGIWKSCWSRVAWFRSLRKPLESALFTRFAPAPSGKNWGAGAF